jgi:hypothetical protein
MYGIVNHCISKNEAQHPSLKRITNQVEKPVESMSRSQESTKMTPARGSLV